MANANYSSTDELKVVALLTAVLILKYFCTVIFQGARRKRAPEGMLLSLRIYRGFHDSLRHCQMQCHCIDGFQPEIVKDVSEQLTAETKKIQFTEEERYCTCKSI